MSGAAFLRKLTDEYELSAAELMLAEAAARSIDRAGRRARRGTLVRRIVC
jgi:hypothetical protein